jgi:hypothetical protein
MTYDLNPANTKGHDPPGTAFRQNEEFDSSDCELTPCADTTPYRRRRDQHPAR